MGLAMKEIKPPVVCSMSRLKKKALRLESDLSTDKIIFYSLSKHC